MERVRALPPRRSHRAARKGALPPPRSHRAARKGALPPLRSRRAARKGALPPLRSHRAARKGALPPLCSHRAARKVPTPPCHGNHCFACTLETSPGNRESFHDTKMFPMCNNAVIFRNLRRSVEVSITHFDICGTLQRASRCKPEGSHCATSRPDVAFPRTMAKIP